MVPGQNTAINEDKIERCILDFTNYLERLKSIFNRLNDAVTSTETFYISPSGEEFRKSFRIFSNNFNVILNNLSSYIDEIKMVQLHYGQFGQKLSEDLSKNAINLEEQYDRYQG